MGLAGAIAGLVLGVTGASALTVADEAVPAVCQGQEIDYAACAEAAGPGSPLAMLSYMNLGTQAFMVDDFARAAAYYDLSTPPDGGQTFSDAFLHAYRAYAFKRVGRLDDATRDAQLAWRWLQSPSAGGRRPPWTSGARDHVLTYILDIMVDQDVPGAQDALDMYLTLPADDWIALVNRVGVLTEIGRLEEALPLSEAALDLESEHPAVTNNHCYLLTLMGRAGEALSYCERALVMEPQNPTLLATHARTLAALGLCDQSEYQRAAALALEPGYHALAEPYPCTPESPDPAAPGTGFRPRHAACPVPLNTRRACAGRGQMREGERWAGSSGGLRKIAGGFGPVSCARAIAWPIAACSVILLWKS